MNPEVATVRDWLRLDAAVETERIVRHLRETVRSLRRQGVVVGASGGIDSSVVASLCVRALGGKRVRLLSMPEKESSSDSVRLARSLADSLGIECVIEDVTGILEGADCYRRRDDAVRMVVPEYGAGYKCKIALPGLLDPARYAVFSVVTEAPGGERKRVRLTAEAYLAIVAATNFKQRARKMVEYYHADLLGYAVAGTPNRLEFELGFFVKNGDGAADLKPIAHLYKSQVYQLAAYLGVPEEISRRPPTTDTYTLEQSQEEFYFTVALERMDACLYGANRGMSAEDVSRALDMPVPHVERVFELIESGRRSARYLSAPAARVEQTLR